MKFAWDVFRHYLLSRRAGSLIRTVAWLCMCGVSLGVMALVVVTSVMNGFNGQIRSRLLAVEPHLIAKIPGIDDASVLKSTPLYSYLHARPDTKTDLFETQEVIIRTVDGLFQGAVAKGIEPGALSYIINETRRMSALNHKKTLPDVETPPADDPNMRLGPGEIFIGIDLARGLGIFEGDKIVVLPPEALLLPEGEAPPFERLVVKGFLRTDIEDIDDKVLFFGRGESLKTLHGSTSHEVGFEVRIRDPEQIDQLKSELTSRGADVTTWIDRNSALFYALKMEKIAMSAFLGLAALIASFSIITVLVLLLTQKRKDVGLLMALGMSPKNTRWLFVRVGLMLSSFGILSGLLLGLLICFVIARYPLPVLPDIYYEQVIPAKVDWRFVGGVLVMAALIAFVSADLPVRGITREMPADALRAKRAKLA